MNAFLPQHICTDVQNIYLCWQINLYCILKVQFCSIQCALLGNQT